MAKQMTAAEKRLVHVLRRTCGWGAGRALAWLRQAARSQLEKLEDVANALITLDQLPEIIEPPTPPAAEDQPPADATL